MNKLLLIFVSTLLMLSGCQSTGKSGKPLTAAEIEQKRQDTIKMADKGLEILIKQNPQVAQQIASSAGFAVFDATNVNIVLLVLAQGEGVLFDKRRNSPIYMQTVKTGEGLGAGYSVQYQVIIFKSPLAIDQFILGSIDGQTGGMDVDANFSVGSGGYIRSFNPDITFYTVGLSGFDAQANYGGSLYLVDNQLNDVQTMQTLPVKK